MPVPQNVKPGHGLAGGQQIAALCVRRPIKIADNLLLSDELVIQVRTGATCALAPGSTARTIKRGKKYRFIMCSQISASRLGP